MSAPSPGNHALYHCSAWATERINMAKEFQFPTHDAVYEPVSFNTLMIVCGNPVTVYCFIPCLKELFCSMQPLWRNTNNNGKTVSGFLLIPSPHPLFKNTIVFTYCMFTSCLPSHGVCNNLVFELWTLLAHVIASLLSISLLNFELPNILVRLWLLIHISENVLILQGHKWVHNCQRKLCGCFIKCYNNRYLLLLSTGNGTLSEDTLCSYVKQIGKFFVSGVHVYVSTVFFHRVCMFIGVLC